MGAFEVLEEGGCGLLGHTSCEEVLRLPRWGQVLGQPHSQKRAWLCGSEACAKTRAGKSHQRGVNTITWEVFSIPSGLCSSGLKNVGLESIVMKDCQANSQQDPLAERQTPQTFERWLKLNKTRPIHFHSVSLSLHFLLWKMGVRIVPYNSTFC